jgi:hypothetical protein
LVTLHIVLALLSFDPTPHTGGDNAAYISLARSLLEHGSYLELYDPALPPHTQYPPAFPGILALAILLGLGSWVSLKLVVVAFSGAAVGATYLWLRRRSGPRMAAGVALLLASSPVILDLSHWVLSDVPFWALTALALWAYDSMEGEATRRDRGMVVVATVATVLAYFTRSAGLPLALAAGGWLAWRRRWRELGILAATLLPLALLWWLRARSMGGVDYVSQFWWVDPYTPELGRIGFSGLLGRIAENALRYGSAHLPLLLVGRVGGVAVGLGIAVTALALAGWVGRLRRPGVTEIFFPLYIGLILVWPAVWSGERFLLPAYPLILGYAAESVVRLARLVRPGAVTPFGAIAVALVLLLSLPALWQGIQMSILCTTLYRAGDPYPCLGPVWRDFFGIAEWSRDSIPADAVVISRKPRLFYGLSARRGLIYPFSTDPEQFFAAVRESGARYIVLDQVGGTTARYIGPILETRPEAFCFLHATESGHAALLGILPAAERVSDSDHGGDADRGFANCPSDYHRLPLDE